MFVDVTILLEVVSFVLYKSSSCSSSCSNGVGMPHRSEAYPGPPADQNSLRAHRGLRAMISSVFGLRSELNRSRWLYLKNREGRKARTVGTVVTEGLIT
jgi:hypothetical protein